MGALTLARRRQAVGFHPTDLPNLTGWWAADRIALADGAAVTTWPDLSGAGHDLSQSTASLKPLVHQTTVNRLINGQPAVYFDGTDDELRNADAAPISDFFSASAFSIFAVFKALNIGTDDATIYNNDAVFSDTNGYVGLHLRSSGTARAYNYDGSADEASVAYAQDEIAVVHMRHEAGTLYISKNGGAEVSVASGDTGNITGALCVGARSAVAYPELLLGELFICSSALAAADVLRANRYLERRFGITVA